MLLQHPPSSTILAPSDVPSFLSPAFSHSLYLAVVFQRLLSTTTVFVLFRAYLLSALLLRQSFYAAQILLVQSAYASALLAQQIVRAATQTLTLSWRATTPLRKKLVFEFMVFVLGAGGNNIILLVFWPGWLVVGPGVWGVMWACG
jgi:hypothetical protein